MVRIGADVHEPATLPEWHRSQRYSPLAGIKQALDFLECRPSSSLGDWVFDRGDHYPFYKVQSVGGGGTMHPQRGHCWPGATLNLLDCERSAG